MAIGSFAGLLRYCNKTLGLQRALAALADGRAGAQVPLEAILVTWLVGMMRQLGSTEQVGHLFADRRWRKRLGLEAHEGGSPDTLARALEGLTVEELNELQLQAFFQARRAGLLQEGGPYGQRCAVVDLNELFTSEKIHCPHCQTRQKTVVGADGSKRLVTEYFHQAVALVFAGSEVAWPLGWELLGPGEGELTAAVRLLQRLLPRLSRSLDLVLGDALYCCRPFFEVVCAAGLQALAISSGQTELDEHMDEWMACEPAQRLRGLEVDLWALQSDAWAPELKRNLRVLHYQRAYPAQDWKHERRQLRVITSAPVELLPAGQGWKVGRCRWTIENGTFNLLTRDYSLTHNYRHDPTAILALLVLRSLAGCLTWAYRRFATARAKSAPRSFVCWFEAVLVEDWVRFLDGAFMAANPLTG